MAAKHHEPKAPEPVAIKITPEKAQDLGPLSSQAIKASYTNGIKNAKAYRLKELAILYPEVAELIK